MPRKKIAEDSLGQGQFDFAPQAEPPRTRPVPGRYIMGALLRKMIKLKPEEQHRALMSMGLTLSDIQSVVKAFHGLMYHHQSRLRLNNIDLQLKEF